MSKLKKAMKYLKTKFNLNDGLSLNKMLKTYNIVIFVRPVFHEGNKYYRQGQQTKFFRPIFV